MSAKFIVFEGCDRSGKSTQANILLNSLKNSVLINFPNRETPIGKMLNSYLTSDTNMTPEVSHLLFTANRWEMQETIKNHLKNNINVICDRYYYSGVAYSVANGLDVDWCVNTNSGLIEPDIVIYMSLDCDIASKRSGYGLEKGENIPFQQLIQEGYKYFSKYNNWNIVDANQDIDDISSIINKLIN